MEKWLETLRDALDLVEYGVLLLDEKLVARFVNQAFREMWTFPEIAPDQTWNFERIMRHGHHQDWHYAVSDGDLDSYVADRIARVRAGHDGPRMLRLTDGRSIKFQCIPLPQGGRMLTYADVTELVRAVEQLEAVVNIDHLTQIHNRRYLYARGEQETALARRHGRPLSLVMLDIDHFKKVNDLHGHPAGDAVLHAVAQCCNNTKRVTDLAGRLGGEEFAVLLPETPLPQAMQAAERLRQAIAAGSVHIDGRELNVSASFGVACLQASDADFGALLQRADTALYRAKREGRNRVIAAD